jgi:hypothetical protein
MEYGLEYDVIKEVEYDLDMTVLQMGSIRVPMQGKVVSASCRVAKVFSHIGGAVAAGL